MSHHCVPAAWRSNNPLFIGALALFLGAVGCVDDAADGEPKADPSAPPEAPADAPAGAASQPSAPAASGTLVAARPKDDAEYLGDPETFPKRLGITRRFLQASQINYIRDPVFIPGTHDVVLAAKVGAVPGLWRLSVDSTKKAELIIPSPLFDRRSPPTAKNRSNWFIGTPRVFPDGKHVIFEGTRNAPREKFSNVIGIVPMTGGIISAVEVEGLDLVRTPDVHPDGEHIIFSSCTELRTAKLNGRGDQKVESTVLLELPRLETKSLAACTLHRPRYSPDGKQIVFEVVGQFLRPDLKQSYGVPDPLNAADYLLEPWIANADGTGIRRLLKNESYDAINGRLQSGGTKEPEFTADGKWVVFSHGRNTAIVNTEGTKARIIAPSVIETERRIQFHEGDPATSDDGRYVVVASDVPGSENEPKPAPAGIAVIDLKALEIDVGPKPKTP